MIVIGKLELDYDSTPDCLPEQRDISEGNAYLAIEPLTSDFQIELGSDFSSFSLHRLADGYHISPEIDIAVNNAGEDIYR